MKRDCFGISSIEKLFDSSSFFSEISVSKEFYPLSIAIFIGNC